MNQPKIQQKTAQLNRLAAEAEGLQRRYSAHLLLYEAACMSGNDTEVAQRRDECHTMLDAILDNMHAVHKLSGEVRRLMSGG